MSKEKIVFISAMFVLLGILIQFFLIKNITYAIELIIILIILYSSFIKPNKVYLIFIPLFLFGIFLGTFALKDLDYTKFENKNNHKTIILSEAKSSKEGTVKYEVGFIEDRKIKTLITLPSNFFYKIGDCVSFTGKFERIENFDGFDYINFLKKDNIYFVSRFPIETGEVKKCEELSLWLTIRRNLQKVKQQFIKNIRGNIKEPEGALASGIVIGGRSVLPQELSKSLTKAGTIHIAVLSGYNITIISEIVTKILSSLTPFINSFLTVLIIILFTITAGPEPPIIRAAIMSIIIIIARTTGRTYIASRGLFVAAFIMVLFNPLILKHDISFHLTLLASIGIIFFTPVVEKYIKTSQKMKKSLIYEILITTIATQLLLLPYLLYTFAEVSVVSIIANIFTLISIPYLMMFTIIGGVLVGIPFIGFIGEISLLITSLLSSYVIFVAEILGGLPFATVTFKLPFILMLIWYGFYIYIILRTKQQRTFVRQLAN